MRLLQQSIDISCSPGPQQQTSSRVFAVLAHAGADRRKDTVPFHNGKGKGTHVPYVITQCYLPPGRGDIHSLTTADRLACWTEAQKARVQTAAATLSGNSLRQTVHTHCASVHQAAKLVAALLRVAGVTADLAESNGSPPPGL